MAKIVFWLLVLSAVAIIVGKEWWGVKMDRKYSTK